MPKINKKTRQPKAVSGKGYCRKCMRTISLNNFYEATNPMLDSNGHMSICKECCNSIYNHYFSIYGNMKDALLFTCQDLDVRFSKQTLEQTQSHIEKLLTKGRPADAVFGYYKSKLMSTGKNNEGIDSFRYKDSYLPKEDNQNIEIKNDYEDDISATDDDIGYWGRGKDSWEYEFLNNEMFKLKTDFECPDYGMEMIMKDICFVNLEIEKIRQGINSGDVVKLIESRSKLMNDGNLKPVQSTGADKNEKLSFGVFIKKWENEKPVSRRLDDEMKRYIDTYMIGHLAKMEGLNNELVKKYEAEIQEYTIDLSEINRLDDEDE